MAAGYRPFRDICASQGPLSLDLFYPTFMLFEADARWAVARR